jgi:hypothetical protein
VKSALEGWPEEVSYTHTPDMSDVTRHDKRLLRQDYLPGVAIRRVTDHAHPAYGQSALYATAGFRLGDVLGQYTGKGDAQTLGRRVRDAPVGHGPEFRLLHAGRGCGDDGNELRMINDFRGVPGATGPNCRFSRAAIRGFRAALIVAIKPIAPNEELLLDYGEVYWRPELADEEERRPGSPKVDSECECACLARCARRAQSALRTATPFSNRGCLETIQGSTFVSASTSPRTHAQVECWTPAGDRYQGSGLRGMGLSTIAQTTSVSRSSLHCFCIEPHGVGFNFCSSSLWLTRGV